MKCRRWLSLITTVFFAVTLILPVSAIESRASDQISSYYMEVTPTSGALAVYFNIIGTGKMDKIGCESIYVYKNVDGSWVFSQKMTEDDENMSNTSIHAHGDTIYCYEPGGYHYKVEVTLFSENSKGRDTRSRTFYVTGK